MNPWFWYTPSSSQEGFPISVNSSVGITGGGSIAAGGAVNLMLAINTLTAATSTTSTDEYLLYNGSAHETATLQVMNVALDHNQLLNYVGNQHIDHTTVSVSAGSGLTGGGTIAANRTLSIASGGVTNAMLAGSITNANLSNSSITATPGTGMSGGGSTALGGSFTFTLSTPVSVTNGGTGVSNPTVHALQVGAGSSALTQLAVGATNQVLLGNTTADPSWGTVANAALANSSVILSSGTNITITGSPLSLGGTATVNVAAPFAATTLTSHGILLGAGSSNITASAVGTNGQIFIGVTSSAPAWITPTAGTGLSVTANGTTLSWGLSTPVTLANGGLGASSFTTNGVLYGNSTTSILVTAQGAANSVLVANAGAPSFSSTPTLTSVTFGSGSALSAYAVGSFTPAIAFGGGTTGITYSGQAGYYTQIGNLIFYQVKIIMSAVGSATGTATLTGFPTAAGNPGSTSQWEVISDVANLTLTGIPIIGFVNGATSATIYASNNGTLTALTNSAFSATTTLIFNGHYTSS